MSIIQAAVWGRDNNSSAPTTARPRWWYLGPVTVQVQASDAVSGIAAAQASLDGGAWQNGPVTVPEGQHSVTVRAEDGAGWESTAQANIKVDTSPPEITLASGAAG